jgi:hypothetical protein
VDVTLDKDTFAVNEDIPLHLAVENFDSESPVYGSGVPDDFCDGTSFFRIEVRDVAGLTLLQSERTRAKNAYDEISGSLCGALTPYPKGKAMSFETTLGHEGWLPKHPGTYTVVVALIPWLKSKNESDTPGIRAVPNGYAIVQSEVTLHIIESRASQ